VLVVLVGSLGTGPFVKGLRDLSLAALAAALVITALSILAAAWRWRLVARGLGLDVPLGSAFTACYRAAFLNSTLPGGVLGDVHRAVDRGRRTGELGRTVRSVAWERSLGQGVQVVLTVVVLLSIPSPVRTPLVVAAVLAVAVGTVVVLVVRGRPLPGRGWPTRVLRAAVEDLAAILEGPRVWLGIVTASLLVALGHAAVFVVAVRASGESVPLRTALPLALVVLLAAAIPANLAGWGPREGAAAWAFGFAGLGAAQGVTVSVMYGVMALAATLPGALALVPLRRAAPEAVGRA
jgi:glycosyltransferase 2 family protein